MAAIDMSKLSSDYGYGYGGKTTKGSLKKTADWAQQAEGTQSSGYGPHNPEENLYYGNQQGQGGNYDWMTGGNMDPFGSIAYPQEWTDYGNYLKNFMSGGANIGRPGIWDWTENQIRGMGATGMPVDVSGLYGAMKPVSERYLQEQGADLAEQFGVGGIRYSTPLQASLVRETERMGENMALQQVQAQIAAEEAARGRMMGAYGLGLNLGQGDVSLGQANAANRMNALGQYGNYANTMLQFPLQLAQQMSGMGQDWYNQQQSAAMGGQMNPWLQQALQYSSQLGGTPQTYQPSGWTQFLGGLNQISPWLQQLLGNKGGGGGAQDALNMGFGYW